VISAKMRADLIGERRDARRQAATVDRIRNDQGTIPRGAQGPRIVGSPGESRATFRTQEVREV
jgi:hypothetical protein